MAIPMLVITFLLIAALMDAQAPTRIYVESITNKGGSISLRDALIKRLKNEKTVLIASTASEADRVLGGFGETYVKGHIGRNHRVRYKNIDSRPIYGGYLSVELKDKDDETTWSNLVTPSRFGGEDIGKDLAGQVVERLMTFLSGSPGATGP